MKNLFLLIKTIISGFFTGIIFAIPLGPAGMEAIKRTISYGLKEGILVSLGAVIADAMDIILINIGLFNLFNQNKKTEGIFFILCGILILFFAYNDIKNYNKKDDGINKFDSAPLLKGFLIAVTNPLNHSFWLTISGTLIHQFSSSGALNYYLYLFFIILGIFVWFIILNLAALKGLKKFTSTSENKPFEKGIILIMLLIGIGFIIYGLYNFI